MLAEVVIYSILLLLYYLVVLRTIGQPLFNLFRLNPLLYAVLGLILILVQGVILDQITTFLVGRLGLEMLE